MKKIKLALVALTTVLGVGGAIAATSGAPGDYYTSQTGSTQIQGQKGQQWDCDASEAVTCSYLEVQGGERIRVEGEYFEK